MPKKSAKKVGRAKLTASAAEAAMRVGPPTVCYECKRDPAAVPAAKVVAHGLCAMDYNRARREARRKESGQEIIPTTRRLGVKARVTIWMTATEQGEVKQTARAKRKSVSDWGAELLLAAVADHKKTTGALSAPVK